MINPGEEDYRKGGIIAINQLSILLGRLMKLLTFLYYNWTGKVNSEDT